MSVMTVKDGYSRVLETPRSPGCDGAAESVNAFVQLVAGERLWLEQVYNKYELHCIGHVHLLRHKKRHPKGFKEFNGAELRAWTHRCKIGDRKG